MTKSIIAALLVLLIVGSLWSFASFLSEKHKERILHRQEQLSKDLSVKRPSVDAWRRHAGVD